MRGYFGIGIYNIKTEANLGTLWRSAHALGANFIFTIGRRYQKQASDTTKAWKHVPLISFTNFDHFHKSIPYGCMLIGVEQSIEARCITKFCHPDRCIYLLGAEDNGLSKSVISKCLYMVQIPTSFCLNVSVAGSIIMYDRKSKLKGN